MKWNKIAFNSFEKLNFNKDLGVVSHISNPVAYINSDSEVRIFFSCRRPTNQSVICSAKYNMLSLEFVPGSEKLEIDIGSHGAFDCNGLSMSCLTTVGKDLYLYYLGWNLGVDVPFRNSVGLAIYDKFIDSFKRFSLGPILGRNCVDPFTISYPFVMHDNGVYKMWYGSHVRYASENNNMIHVIKYCESNDGIYWQRENTICLDACDDVYAYSRPCIIKEDGIYKMWYSFRGQAYRIGYAESLDGLHWNVMNNKVGIDVSESGWDSEMIEYPFVFDFYGKRYMLFNGNSYGRDGMGVAQLDGLAR